jgi:hypothetical protein
MDKLKQDTLLGVVFFVGLGLLLWATAKLSNLSFGKLPELTVAFPSAAGLRVGDSVYVVGTRSGHVAEVLFRQDQAARIAVRIELDREVTVFDDYRITIVDSSLLGGKQVDVEPGSSGRRVADLLNLRGEVEKGAVENVGKSLGEADIAGTVASIKRFFDQLNERDGTIGALVRERVVHDELLETLKSLRRSADAIERGQGAIGRAIHDEGVGNDFAELVHDARDAIGKINSGRGPLGRLVSDEALGDKLVQFIEDLHVLSGDVRHGRGAIGVLLRDDKTARAMQDLVADAASVAHKLDDPRAGILPGLLGDQEWRKSVDSMLSDAREFINGLTEGPGLIRALVFEKDLAEEFRRMLNQIARAIEDAREAAPVGTFFAVLAGPF